MCNEFANILYEFQSAFSAAFRIIDEKTEPEDVSDAYELNNIDGLVEFDKNSSGNDGTCGGKNLFCYCTQAFNHTKC